MRVLHPQSLLLARRHFLAQHRRSNDLRQPENQFCLRRQIRLRQHAAIFLARALHTQKIRHNFISRHIAD